MNAIEMKSSCLRNIVKNITIIGTFNFGDGIELASNCKDNKFYNIRKNDGALVDENKNDGYVLVKEDILLKQTKGLWLFTHKNK